jgi:TatD DNase family protein
VQDETDLKYVSPSDQISPIRHPDTASSKATASLVSSVHQPNRKRKSSTQHTNADPSVTKKAMRSVQYQARGSSGCGDGEHRCPVSGCMQPNKYQKAHAYTYHLPAIFKEKMDPEKVTSNRIGALLWLGKRLCGPWVRGLSDLATWVSSSGALKHDRRKEVTPLQAAAMRIMARDLDMVPPQHFTLEPLNSPVVLLHWRAVIIMFSMLSASDQRQFLEMYSPLDELQSTIDLRTDANHDAYDSSALRSAFDSHYHHDRTCRAFGLHGPTTSFDDMRRPAQPLPHHEVHLVGAVANFCDPETWPTITEMNNLNSQGIRVAIGIHPKTALRIQPRDYLRFGELAASPLIHAIGEVGLDHSKPSNEWYQQEQMLKHCLKSLSAGHVLVLHCRGMKDKDPSEAYYRLLDIMLGARVPSEQRIHMHCFGGSRKVTRDWLSAYPNTWFGFTLLARHFQPDQREALQLVNNRFLLLETDSPYFAPPSYSNSTPNLIGMVAEKVAEIRGQTTEEVLRLTTENAQYLYT